MAVLSINTFDSGCNTDSAGGFARGRFNVDGQSLYWAELTKLPELTDELEIPGFEGIAEEASTGSFSFLGLEDGAYTVTAVGADGSRSEPLAFQIKCTTTAPPPITQDPCTLAFVTPFSQTPNTDETNNNGTVIGRVSGAQGIVRYSLDEGPWQELAVFAGLATGEHKLSAKDENGCVVNTTFETAYVPPCSLSVDIVRVLGDTAMVFVSSEFDMQYSWDGGATWGPDWQRSCLQAGSYDFVAKDAAGCTAEVPIEIVDPYALAPRALYFLIVDGRHYDITEPLKYDALDNELNRDKTRHGILAEYSRSDLGFDCEAGYQIIHDLYHEQGSDAEIGFVAYFKECDSCGYGVEYAGRLDMTEFLNKDGVITVPVEAESLMILIAARRTSKVDLNGAEGLDGLPMDAIAPNKTTLHSKAIVKAFDASANDPLAMATATSQMGSRTQTAVLGFNNILVSDLQKTNNLFTGLSATGGRYPVFEFVEDLTNGVLEFNLDVLMVARRQNGDFDKATAEIYFQINSEPRQVLKSIHEGEVNGTFETDSRGGLKAYRKIQRDFVAGDKIYLWGQIEAWDVRGSYVIQFELLNRSTSYFRVTGETTTPGSVTNMYPLHEALAKVLSSITGKTDVLRSNFFGRVDSLPRAYPETGCGANFLIGSGFMLRGITAKPFSLALNDLLDIVDPLFCIGMGLDRENGKEVVTIEKAEEYYQDKLIASYASITDFEESAAMDHVFNTVSLGFTKWQPEGKVENGLDEPVTRREWQTPVKSHKNEYKKECKAIAGGYLIEAQRRIGPSMEDAREDNSTFLVAVTSKTVQNFVYQFLDAQTAILRNYEPSLVMHAPGSVFTLEGPQNAGTYTVVSREMYFYADPAGGMGTGTKVVIAEAFPVPYYFNFVNPDYALGSTEFEAERDQPFSAVRNIYSPGTAYNLRLTPARLFLNHALFINSGCYFKKAYEIYRSTYAEGNLRLETRLKNSELCVLGDVDRALIAENENLTIAQAQRAGRLYKPTFLTFSVGMERAEFANVRANRHGFIGLLSPEGWRAGFIMTAQYNRKKKTCKFKLLERAVFFAGPVTQFGGEFNKLEFNEREFN